MISPPTTWYASGFFYSSVALQDLELPFVVRVARGDAASSSQVIITDGKELQEHEARCIRYRCIVTFEATQGSAWDIAAESIARVADRLALLGRTAVEAEVGTVTTAPPGAKTGRYSSVGRGRLVASEPEVIALPTFEFQRLLSRFPTDERTVRALRWLRRSYLTDDLLLNFISLAFGLESIAPNIEVPRTTTRPSIGDRIRSLAVDRCGVSEATWKKVGGLRHSLFHGGVIATEDARETVAFAVGWSEYVLVMGIKQLFGLAADEHPVPEKPGGTLTNVVMSGEGPPEHMWLNSERANHLGRYRWAWPAV